MPHADPYLDHVLALAGIDPQVGANPAPPMMPPAAPPIVLMQPPPLPVPFAPPALYAWPALALAAAAGGLLGYLFGSRR